MPISHITKFYGIVDAKIAKLTADPAGGTTTYAASIDVPGIKGVAISGDVDTKELRGDNALLDLNSILKNVKCTIRHGKLSLDVLPVVLGGATVDSGTTPNMVATYDLLGSSSFSYFKLEGKTPDNGVDVVGGDGHIILHKLILTSLPDLGFEEEDYRIHGMDAGAVPLLGSTNKWISIILNETKVAIT